MKRELIQSDPSFYIEQVLGASIWTRQKDISESVIKNKRTCVKSCHGSGKTFISARIALKFLHSYPHSIVISTAPTFRQVRDLLWKEINTAYSNAKYKLPGDMLDVRYNLDADWYGVGLSTDDPTSFQGYHAPYILVIGDEASGIKRDIFDAIDGITSTGYTRILLIGNPTDPTGYFADTFKSELWNKLTISCFDTPNFSTIQSLEQLRNSTQEQRDSAVKIPYLITPQWAYERMGEWRIDSPLFQARVLGEFPKEADDTLIALHYVESAIERQQTGDEEQIGLDVARFGSDRTVFAFRKGNKIINFEWFAKEDTMQTVGRAINYLRQFPEAIMKVDEIGVGAGVVDRLKESEFSDRVFGVNVAEKAEDDENMKYVNLRAKAFWQLRERFVQNDIALIDKGTVISDLTNIKYKFRSSDGALQIESKEEMKKRGLRSPDMADAMMLAFCGETKAVPDIHFV